MIKLIAVIDSVRGMVENPPEDIVTIYKTQLDKYNHARMTLYGAFSGLEDIKRSIEAASALEHPVWVLGNSTELEVALPYATELFIIQVDGILGGAESFPKFEHSFYMYKRKPIQKTNGLMYQCQQWKPDVDHRNEWIDEDGY